MTLLRLTTPGLLTVTLLAIPQAASAYEYGRLQGAWDCDEGGTRSRLEFLSPSQLRYNGVPTTYQMLPDSILVEEEYGFVQYYCRFEGGTLVIFSPDGSVSRCRRAAQDAPAPAAPGQQAAGAAGALVPGPSWPTYQRPAGRVSEDRPSPQALLYKSAGRWDHVTSNTLTNLYLKPDGTYEESYEAGYGGQFHDQGGCQTGRWGATGAEQGGGRWMLQGSLKQGTLTLIDAAGNHTAYQYRVHYENGQYYWSEYFFNGELYSVTYIYR